MLLRKCYICGKEKTENEFYWQNKAKKIKSHNCKTCADKATNKWRAKNRKHVLSQKINMYRHIRERNGRHIFEYLKTHPCVTCGESDPLVLEFDHLPGVKKFRELGNLKNHTWSLETIDKEMAKCQVLCANCHRRKTQKERRWLK